MKRLLSIPSYAWAIICMCIIPITFIGNDYFARKMATLQFMKVNPIYTGGDSLRCLKQDSMMITINKPVFESLIGAGRKGFVQIKFAGELPDFIQSDIDYDNDSITDFNLNINRLTGETKFKVLTKQVTELDVSSRVNNNWIVRVKILNPDKK